MLRRSAWRREWQWDCSLPGFEMFEVFQAGIWPHGARVSRRRVSVSERGRARAGQNVRFAWVVMGAGVGAWLVVA
jgi:hypothetical protein